MLQALVSQGVTDALDDVLRKRIRLTNGLALFAALVMFASIPFDWVTAPRWMLVEDVVGGLAYLAIPLVNRAGFYTTSRLICVTMSNLIVLGNAVLLGPDSGAPMVFIAVAAVPFALFDLRERWPLAAGVVLALVCYAVAAADVFAALRSVSANYSASAYQVYSAVITVTVLLFILGYTAQANARAERELRQRREHYRLITQAAGDAIITVDENDRVVFASPAAERIFGHPIRELLDRPLGDLASFATDPTTDFVQGVGRRRDGGSFPMEISIGQVQSGDRQIRTAVIRDITARLRAERELEQTRQAAIQSAKMAALGEMSGNIAHEINNPLSAIMLRVQRLTRTAQDGRLDQDLVTRTAREVERTVDRIARIVDALRSFARDVEKDPKRPESVLQIVKDSVELCAERLERHAITLEVGAIPGELLVECRSVQISQILLNLLSNARDAIEDLPTRWVRISAEALAGGDEVEIRVTDSGNGIPADIQPRIMEPFFTTKEFGKGTGLGLSVSKGIAEAHGGRLSYDPHSPNTSFVLTLRRGRAEPTAAAAAAAGSGHQRL